MNKIFKKVISFVTAAAIIASIGTVAMAQSEMDNMVLAGYDLTDPANPNRIYNEVIGGQYTNKQVLVPVTPTWKAEGYESVYPYAGYSRMYLDGKKQNITVYNNTFPQWEERRQDYMWELKAPYLIWERQQTKVNNKTWTWDFGNPSFGIPDEALKTKTNRAATVVNIEWKPYGFGKYENSGALLDAYQVRMYSDFSVNAISIWENAVANKLNTAALSARDPQTNKYVMTDADIQALIPVVNSKYITAKFNPKGNKGLQTKDVANEYLAHMNDGWAWDYDSFYVTYDAKIDWTAPAYEMAEPYNMYQYLIVNDIVLDGTNGKDKVLRYTGGKATPKVTWKFEFFQNMIGEDGNSKPGVYEVVEKKYVDGVAAVDKNGNPIYRVPTGEYGNTFFKVNGNIVEYWVVDKAGHQTLLATANNYAGSLGGLIDAYCNGSFKYTGAVPAEAYKMLP